MFSLNTIFYFPSTFLLLSFYLSSTYLLLILYLSSTYLLPNMYKSGFLPYLKSRFVHGSVGVWRKRDFEFSREL